MEFEPYDSFRSYESPQLQPFSTMPPFEEEPLEPIGPGPQPPDVQMPAYEESPYGEIQPPERPNVQVEDKRFRNYKGFRPMTPIEEGSIRPMKPFDFEPYKPIGQGGE